MSPEFDKTSEELRALIELLSQQPLRIMDDIYRFLQGREIPDSFYKLLQILRDKYPGNHPFYPDKHLPFITLILIEWPPEKSIQKYGGLLTLYPPQIDNFREEVTNYLNGTNNSWQRDLTPKIYIPEAPWRGYQTDGYGTIGVDILDPRIRIVFSKLKPENERSNYVIRETEGGLDIIFFGVDPNQVRQKAASLGLALFALAPNSSFVLVNGDPFQQPLEGLAFQNGRNVKAIFQHHSVRTESIQ